MLNIEVGTTDHLDPEVQAMLLAMYSRSYAPIGSRLPDTAESVLQHKEKLAKFFLSWGHKSVGQLGATTAWFEGVSQLAAKAIEYHNLFNGQESSTRYINYENQPIITPNFGSLDLWEQSREWQEKWRRFYIKALPLTVEKIKGEYPIADQCRIHLHVLEKDHGQIYKNGKLCGLYKVEDDSYYIDLIHEGKFNSEEMETPFSDLTTLTSFLQEKFESFIRTSYENTVKARAFDICGGFLPAGVTTNVGFFGSFDTLNDHFGEMLYHPCEEMRNIAIEVLTCMKEKYPYGTMSLEQLYKRYEYVKVDHFYPDGTDTKNEDFLIEGDHDHLVRKPDYFDEFAANREKYQKFDKVSSSRFNLIFKALLDFRSYRDLHRHRNGVIDMVVFEPMEHDVGEFYRTNIPDSLKYELAELSTEFFNWYHSRANEFPEEKHELQYVVPMGFEMPVTYKCDLNQAMYLAELRSGKTVHQTMREVAIRWGNALKDSLSFDLKLHMDEDEDNFSLKRGEQTLVGIDGPKETP